MDPHSEEEKVKLADFLKVLHANQIINQSTDVHLMGDGRVLFRSKGNVVPAKSWERLTDDKAKLLPEYTFADLKGLLIGKDITSVSGVTVVHRGLTTQVRVQGLRTVDGEKLFLRMQPLEPPKLSKTLAHAEHAALLGAMTNASGLVLVCGPVGSGKTTTAASLVEHWASQRSRHIATVEDPVEYILRPTSGEVSAINVNMLRGAEDKESSFSSVLRDLLRSDIDGLFIGEARDASTRNACLDFAATDEPVVTTVHAGGFSDAVMRLTYSEGGRDVTAMRHVLAQCLHTLIYVDLAFSAKGLPVPVITALPGRLANVRSAIAEGNPKVILTRLHQSLVSCNEQGGTPGASALAAALARGATEESARAALPPEARKLEE